MDEAAVVRVDRERPDSADAVQLVGELEALLAEKYQPEARFGLSVERLLAEDVALFVARVDGTAAACGGVLLTSEYAEIKRMYVREGFRGTGLADAVLERLVDHAGGAGATVLRLETGAEQHAAIRFYTRAGFTETGPFGLYDGEPTSRYFERGLATQ